MTGATLNDVDLATAQVGGLVVKSRGGVTTLNTRVDG